MEDRLIINLHKVDLTNDDYDHDCVEDAWRCGGVEKCAWTTLGIELNWEYDDKLDVELYFTLSIEKLHKLSKETLYVDRSLGSDIVIHDPEEYGDKIIISQYETNEGLQTIIEIVDHRFKINDKTMEISRHILKRFNEIYTEYLVSKRQKIAKSGGK